MTTPTDFNPRVATPATLTTERLLMRPWRESDADFFVAMNADPVIMRYYPRTYTREESMASFERARKHFADRGFGMWAAELTATRVPIGFVGLQVPRFEAHFTPCVEVGWRLAPAHWHKGYATEAAREALRFGFDELRLPEIVAMTVPANTPSIAVMDRLGMARNPTDDFDNPLVNGPFKRHVLYRLQNPR